MNNFIKTPYALLIIAAFFIGSLSLITWANKKIDTFTKHIPEELFSPRSQVATISGAGSGLVAHYTFDDGTATDSAGSNTGTVKGATATGGKIGQALQFDGVDDYVNLNQKIVSMYPFTFSAWVKSPGTQKGSAISISRPGYKYFWSIGVAANGSAYAEGMYNSGSPAQALGTSHISNQWTHIVGTFESDRLRRIYVNGVLEGTNTSGYQTLSSLIDTISIGRSITSDATTYFTGSIDDARIYNRLLSVKEIQELYNFGISGGEQNDSHTLSVIKSGSGSGTISGGSISCGATCTQEDLLSNTQITLTASPDRNSTFSSWNGCTSTSGSTCTISVNSDTTVTATFGTNQTLSVDTTAPSVPTNFSATTVSFSGAQLSWSASTDISVDGQLVSGLAGYNIYRCSGDSCTPTLLTTTTGTSYTDTGLMQGTAYTYAVAAYDSTAPSNVSGQSTRVNVSTQSGPIISGTSVTAPSCSQSDVQTAINAASSGNTVYIPAGNCTWGSSGSYLSVNKNITLNGAGRDITTITISPSAGGWTAGTIRISAPATVKSFTITTSETGNSGTVFSASANGFRITDIKYINRAATTNGYFLYTGAYGLVDSNDITGGAGTNELIFARGPSNSWQTDSSIGGANNLFIENSIFRGRGYVTDCNSNSRCVVRFNTITGGMKIDGHGKASNSPPRGVRHMEIYNNTWTSTGSFWVAMELRGGTGMVFNNSAPQTPQNGGSLKMTDYAYHGTWGNFGNLYQCPNNYPVDDQIGVGKDPKVAGSEPMYLWGNRRSGVLWSLGWTAVPAAAITQCGVTFSMPSVIKANTDYYLEDVGFTGTSGVGIGTLANRPSTCTPRVGYWATDQGEWNSAQSGPDGQLYTCSAPNTWSLSYTPYAYPHPLVTGITPQTPATCTSFTYTSWGTCTGGTQSRTITTSSPSRCTGGAPVLTQTCTVTTGNMVISGNDQFSTGAVVNPNDTDGDGILNTTDKCPLTPREVTVNTHGCPLPLTTRFNTVSPLASADFNTVPTFEVGNTLGKVTYPSGTYKLVKTTGEPLDIDSNLTIDKGLITLNSTNLPELNKPARITLYNLTVTTPVIKKDGVICTTCTVISYINGTLIFTVPSFSTYSVEDGSSPTPTTALLTVVKQGTGSGIVSGTGISCGTDCTETVPLSYLTLTASPSSGSIFHGWSGGHCFGTGSCTFIPTGDSVVVGTFTLIPVSEGGSGGSGGGGGNSSNTGATYTPTTRRCVGNCGETSSSQSSDLPIFVSLTLGQTSPLVLTLQQTLNTKGHIVSITGPGSKGQETTYFGFATQTALKKYQCVVLKRCSGTSYGVFDAQTAISLGIITAQTVTTSITQTSSVPLTISTSFTRSLTVGETGTDVKNLQIFLNSKGFTISTTGAGSKGNETTYFGSATRAALARFQEANNIYPAVGYFGPITMKRINSLISYSN